jgi:thiol-disulfide isomerase/thioredoxin
MVSSQRYMERSQLGGLKISVYFTARCVSQTNRLLRGALYISPRFRSGMEVLSLLQELAVDKIYLESYRFFLHDEKTLERVKDFFKESLEVSGGACLGVCSKEFGDFAIAWWGERNPMRTACMSSEKTLNGLKRIMERSAKVFDEVLIDDFYFSDCFCHRCLSRFNASKGYNFTREHLAEKLFQCEQNENIASDWMDFHASLLEEASKNYVVAPAKAVNPKVKVIMKVPEWYDQFYLRGIDLERLRPIFDGIWVGTESRELTERYGSYFIYRYVKSMWGEKTLGAWFDAGSGITWNIAQDPEIFVEQARMSVLAGAPEITLFCMSNLMDYQRGIHIKRIREEIPALKRLAKLIDGAQPIGIPTPKMRNPRATFSPETYLCDTLGMIGLPIEPVNAKKAKEHPSALITAHGALKSLAEDLLGEGRTLILTSEGARLLVQQIEKEKLGLLGISAENSFKERAWVPNAAAFVRNGGIHGINHRSPSEVPVGPLFKTAQGKPILYVLADGEKMPLAFMKETEDSKVYVLPLTDFPPYLKYYYPSMVRQLFRDIVGEIVGVKIEGPSDVAVFPYQNGIIALENFNNTAVEVKVTLDPSKMGISGPFKVIDPFMGKTLPIKEGEEKLFFELMIQPRSLRVVKVEDTY